VCALALSICCSSGTASAQTVTFDGYRFTPNGTAGLDGTSLQLINNQFGALGTAFITTPYTLDTRTSFTSTFSFTVSNNGSWPVNEFSPYAGNTADFYFDIQNCTGSGSSGGATYTGGGDCAQIRAAFGSDESSAQYSSQLTIPNGTAQIQQNGGDGPDSAAEPFNLQNNFSLSGPPPYDVVTGTATVTYNSTTNEFTLAAVDSVGGVVNVSMPFNLFGDLDTSGNVQQPPPYGYVGFGAGSGGQLAEVEISNFSVTMVEGPPCPYTVTPLAVYLDSTSQIAPALSVTAGGGCAWSTYGYAPFVDFTSGTSGSGDGSVAFSVPANTTGVDLTGGLIVAGQAVSVTQRETAQTFNDVPPSAYYFDAVNLLAAKDITAGCGDSDYCPTQNVTRAEMAIFIVRAMLGEETPTNYPTTPYFTDVPASNFAFPWIQELAWLGITSGCGTTELFCPNENVTRAQMAIFIIRMRYGATFNFDYPGTPYFSDVSSTTFGFSWIQRMAEDNITAGCGPSLYCPNNPVTRGDMAIFIMRGGFNQLLPTSEPILAAISPAGIAEGANGTFTVTGVNTSFVNGTTTIATEPGITVGAVTVTGPTTLTVELTAASGAVEQPISVLAITGTQEAVLPNGLVIQ
jgi:hypothetical protein